MKIKLTFFLFCLSMLSSCAIKERMIKRQKEKPAPVAEPVDESKITQPGDYTIFLNYQGKMRYYKIHIPKSYSPNQPTPLVFALHGGGGDMEIQSTDKYYNQISKSEQEGYIVIFPNGYSTFKSGKLATWNAGKCCGDARDEKIDVDKTLKSLNENRKRKSLNWHTANEFYNENFKTISTDERMKFYETAKSNINRATFGIQNAKEKRKLEREAIFKTMESFNLITITRGNQNRYPKAEKNS